jgi:hypothetical protein
MRLYRWVGMEGCRYCGVGEYILDIYHEGMVNECQFQSHLHSHVQSTFCYLTLHQ